MRRRLPLISVDAVIPENMANPSPTYCPRDPGVETNLRCGRCDELICPRCLVQTPMGARCPDCAAERKNPVFDPSVGETGRAWVAGVGTGVVVAALSWVLANLFPGLFRYVLLIGPAASGWFIGAVVYRASGHKQSRRLQIVSGAATLLSYVIMTYLMGAVYVGGFIGLAVGMWYAIGRVRPPRGS